MTTPSIEIDGECSPALIDFIKQFQSEAVDLKYPGRIDPWSKTGNAIISQLQCAGGSTKAILFGPLPDNTGILSKVNPERFRTLFGRQLGLTVTKGEDLTLCVRIGKTRISAADPKLFKPGRALGVNRSMGIDFL